MSSINVKQLLRFNQILPVALLLVCFLANTSCQRKLHDKASRKKEDKESTILPAPDLKQNKEELHLPESPDLMLSLAKKPCYGECPVFELKLYSDGRAYWHGENFCERIGNHEAFVPLGWRNQLMERAKAIRFFSLKTKYPLKGPDLPELPETVIYFNNGKQEQSITHQYLSPKELIEFEQAVLDIVNGLLWTAGKKETQE
jgi:Domain of unknown function (DUF6438)